MTDKHVLLINIYIKSYLNELFKNYFTL